MEWESPYLKLLKNRINLREVPFTERGSRLLVYQNNGSIHIRLAERWFKRTGQLSAYRKRPPIIEHFRFTDEHGQVLPIETNSYPHLVEFCTPIGAFTLTFWDIETLVFILPPGKGGVQFQANVDQAHLERRGGVLRVTGEIRRSIAYTTNARILSNRILSAAADSLVVELRYESSGAQALLLNITPRLGYNRYIDDVQQHLEDAGRRWHAWFAAAPPVAEPYQAQYYYAWWVMRAGLISTRYYTTREAMTPSKFYYLGVWQWDAYFHALAYRYIDRQLARDQLRILLDHQREDGMLPDAVHDEGLVTHLDFPVEADVTKPPLIAWSAWKLFEMDGDREFLEEIYEPLVRWNHWWFEKNDLDHNGLCEYQHPFSSGLDDSPLWDAGMPVEAPDLNTYLCLQQEALAKIARVIGEKADAIKWQRRADSIAQKMITHMWDSQAGLFWASHLKQRVEVRTIFNLFPLLTGRMPEAITTKLLAHLTNPDEFWTTYPVPTVAVSDPQFNPDQMWRGPTWTNVNYLLIEGLQRNGQVQLANELQQRTLHMVSNHPDIFEYYQPFNGDKPPKAAPIFGWSASIFIDLAIRASQEGLAP